MPCHLLSQREAYLPSGTAVFSPVRPRRRTWPRQGGPPHHAVGVFDLDLQFSQRTRLTVLRPRHAKPLTLSGTAGGRLRRSSNRLPSGENDDCSYCCGAGGGVPPNQPAAYAMTSNTTIATATPYQRRLSLKSIVASRWPVTPILGDLGRHLPESDLFALQ